MLKLLQIRETQDGLACSFIGSGQDFTIEKSYSESELSEMKKELQGVNAQRLAILNYHLEQGYVLIAASASADRDGKTHEYYLK